MESSPGWQHTLYIATARGFLASLFHANQFFRKSIFVCINSTFGRFYVLQAQRIPLGLHSKNSLSFLSLYICGHFSVRTWACQGSERGGILLESGRALRHPVIPHKMAAPLASALRSCRVLLKVKMHPANGCTGCFSATSWFQEALSCTADRDGW